MQAAACRGKGKGLHFLNASSPQSASAMPWTDHRALHQSLPDYIPLWLEILVSLWRPPEPPHPHLFFQYSLDRLHTYLFIFFGNQPHPYCFQNSIGKATAGRGFPDKYPADLIWYATDRFLLDGSQSFHLTFSVDSRYSYHPFPQNHRQIVHQASRIPRNCLSPRAFAKLWQPLKFQPWKNRPVSVSNRYFMCTRNWRMLSWISSSSFFYDSHPC